MSNAFLIGYDLHKMGQRYSTLSTLIERNFPVRWHCLDSTYIVITPLDAVAIRDRLRPALDANDVMLVIPVGPLWASHALPKNCTDWLNANLR